MRIIRKKDLLKRIEDLEKENDSLERDLGALFEEYNVINTEIIKLLTRCDELEEKTNKLSKTRQTKESKAKNNE